MPVDKLPHGAWSDAEVATLLRMRAEGAGFGSIAQALPGRNADGASQRYNLIRAGKKPLPPGCTMPVKGASITTRLTALDCKPGRPDTWSDADKQRLREMWAAGRSQGQIARTMGCSVSRVADKISQLKLRGIKRAEGARAPTPASGRQKVPAVRPAPASPPPAPAVIASPVAEIRTQTAPHEAQTVSGKPMRAYAAAPAMQWFDQIERPRCVWCGEPSLPDSAKCQAHAGPRFIRTAPDARHA